MNYPGYTLVRREDCPEQHGVLTVLKHDVSGAAVLLVENEDTNKAFGIGFGTFPSDDTGVFHILEHSVRLSNIFSLKDILFSLSIPFSFCSGG